MGMNLGLDVDNHGEVNFGEIYLGLGELGLELGRMGEGIYWILGDMGWGLEYSLGRGVSGFLASGNLLMERLDEFCMEIFMDFRSYYSSGYGGVYYKRLLGEAESDRIFKWEKISGGIRIFLLGSSEDILGDNSLELALRAWGWVSGRMDLGRPRLLDFGGMDIETERVGQYRGIIFKSGSGSNFVMGSRTYMISEEIPRGYKRGIYRGKNSENEVAELIELASERGLEWRGSLELVEGKYHIFGPDESKDIKIDMNGHMYSISSSYASSITLNSPNITITGSKPSFTVSCSGGGGGGAGGYVGKIANWKPK